MVWLVSHMWIALAGAAFFGLLLGWSFRGLLLRRKAQTAIVERDIARTELEQAQVEIDGLYSAQRKRAGDGALAALQSTLQAREAELSEAVAALSAAQAEIDRAAAEPVAADTPVDTGDASQGVEPLDAGLNQEDATLVWRNRYLESRVRNLESNLTEQAGSPTAIPAAPPPADEAAVPPPSSGDDAKLRWQTEYLKQRLSVLEASAISAHASAPVVEPVSPPAAPPENVAESPEEPAEEVDEELARLRWRNRYLEGRVAYFEGDTQTSEPAEPFEAAPVQNEPPLIEAETIETVPEAASESDLVVDVDVSGPETTAPMQDMAPPTQPIRLDRPHFGSGDDLTSIEGIGPKIEQVLKDDLGVFHFEQIAAWSPENVAWIEDALGFDGRILREAWIDQARALTEVEGANA